MFVVFKRLIDQAIDKGKGQEEDNGLGDFSREPNWGITSNCETSDTPEFGEKIKVDSSDVNSLADERVYEREVGLGTSICL